MFRIVLFSSLILAAVQLAGLNAAAAAPEGYDRILQKREKMKIAGHTIEVPVDVWLKTEFVTGAAHFNLWADVDLSGFQARMPKIAGRMSRHNKCGDRVRVRSATLKPSRDKARLCLRVHHERWQCLKAAMPNFSGLNLSFKKSTIARTRLVSQNAHVCAQMWPVVSKGGRDIRLEGKVTKNAVSSKAGLFGNMFNARGQFRSRLRRKVNRAMANFKLPVPEALQSFDPVVDEASFRSREDGSLGLVLKMHVEVTSSDLPQILSLLSDN